MVLSKIWYLASTVALPEPLIVVLEKAIFSFLWNGYEFLVRNTLRLSREKGGTNIVNIRLKIASIQLAQISKVVHLSLIHI